MPIQSVYIKNFRLLHDVAFTLHERTSVVVGRNNSGKTSLRELIRRMSAADSKGPKFLLEDFSFAAHDKFMEAVKMQHDGADEADIRKTLPAIELILEIAYDVEADDIGLLGDYVVNLDDGVTVVKVHLSYSLKAGQIDAFFKDLPVPDGSDDRKEEILSTLRERIPVHFERVLFAVNPTNDADRQKLNINDFQRVIQARFINANRALDDDTSRESNALGKVLEALYNSASADGATDADKTMAAGLQDAVKSVESTLRSEVKDSLDALLPSLQEFGYPGLGDSALETQTELQVSTLMQGHTKLRYEGHNGISLPESYSGLGTRNLIYILLKLHEFFKAYQAAQPAPAIQWIFIEEPEAHLHPQMQEVFIARLASIATLFSDQLPDGETWPVQFVVTTHSSHVANATKFNTVRYFLARPSRQTTVKDLSERFAGNEQFLHKYLTLTKCDLFFADKAVLVEGMAERLLLPEMIEKMDIELPPLGQQYLTVMEVGGAYAYRFFEFLQFLELPALVITDLDSVAEKEGKLRKHLVNESMDERTSNATLKNWFSDKVSPGDLLAMSDDDRTDNYLRITYQVPERKGSPCGRSFEEAFILANPGLFDLENPSEQDASDIAAGLKKSEFALEHSIDKTNWTVPKYISDGLKWLSTFTPQPVEVADDEAATEQVKGDG